MRTDMPAKDKPLWGGDEPWVSFVGPCCLLCTLGIALWASQQELFYWLTLALIGMFSSFRYRMRGFVYALALLLAGAIVRHGWFLSEHLWQFGIEGSLACGFWVTALAADQRHSILRSFQELSSAQKSTISHLEQNVAALMSSSQAQQVVLQEKLSHQQKELEETEAELSSILMLNEVLRRNSAGHMKESEELAETVLDRERRLGCLLAEREELQKQLEQIRQESTLYQENTRLFQELQAQRANEAQAQCLGEALSHLQEKLLQQETAASQRLEALENEKRTLQEQQTAQQERLSHLEQENERFLSELEMAERKVEGVFQQLEQEQEAISSAQQKLGQLQAETLSFESELQKQREQNSLQLEEFQAEKRRLQEELLAVRTELENFRADSLAYASQIKESDVEKKRLQEEISSLQTQLKEIRAAEEKSPLRRTDEAHVRTLETSLEHLQKRLAQQESLSSERYHTLALEKQKFQSDIIAAQGEKGLLQAHVQQLSEELAASLTSLQTFQQLQNEKNHLQERLRGAEIEIANLRKAASPITSQPKAEPARLAEREALLAKLSDMGSQMALLEEKIQKSAQTERLYQQLRTQFEEKDAALHETRAQLFRTDTELQKYQLERAHKELEQDPFSKEIEQEMAVLEQEMKDLRFENEQLQQMIADLIKQNNA